MSFLFNKAFYLCDLKGFDPTSGIDIDDNGKYPFFCYGERLPELNYPSYEVFERDDKSIVSLRSFVTYNLDEEMFRCAEPNLNAIFNRYGETKILVNHAYQIKEEQKLDLKRNFCTGYRAGIKHSLRNEIGISFANMSYDLRIEILEDFIAFCKYHSFFEGFGTPGSLYCIGFIQAQLILALKEKAMLDRFEKEKWYNSENETKTITNPDAHETSERILTIENASDSFSESSQLPRIKIFASYAASEILDIWSVLLEVSSLFPLALKSDADLRNLLNSMFYCDNFSFSDDYVHFDTSAFGASHQDILKLLMKVSKDINRKGESRTDKYVEMLTGRFLGVFNESNDTIKKNWKGKAGDAWALLKKELPENKVIIRFSEILRKYNVK